MPNRLAKETSPYLRQHQDNPVDWYPWGEEALARARAEDKPILLSIGYSACHWCHVMAHESFEDAATAAEMNRDFVNIKVDREEHPDVDQLYQHALQLFGEGGGWPLTMFLLPSGEPFYGGTYFPPRDSYGRASFRRVLAALAAAYRNDRKDVVAQAGKLVEALGELESRGAGTGDGRTPPPAPRLVARTAARLATRMDAREGGFEGAPKFPSPTALSLFLRAAARSGDPDPAEPALLTLLHMAQGGIYDHLGGGFARYSTDAHWLVPHFEKMLYDNGQLVRLYAEGAALLRTPTPDGGAPDGDAAALADRFARVITETAGWLEREMRDPSGGLYAAQDADSEGVEGKYFVWTPAQVEAALAPLGTEAAAAARLFCRVYDVTPGGNWRDPHGHAPPNASVLHPVAAPADMREAMLLARARVELLRARQQRVPPGTDDKILAGWNGLAIGGLAEAGRLLQDPALLEAARRTADFVLTHMRDAAGGLLRTRKRSDPGSPGAAALPATLDDHAFVAEGLFYLASATSDLRYLAAAFELTDAAIARFYDPARSVFYVGPEETAGVRLVLRPVSLYDSAVPSGLSVLCMNLLRLSALAGDAVRRRYLDLAEQTLRRHAEAAQKNPIGLANLIAALDLLEHGLTTTVIVDPARATPGAPPSAGARALVAAAAAAYVPDHFVLVCAPDADADGAVYAAGDRDADLPPALSEGLRAVRKGKRAHAAQATAYLCRGTRCTPPLTDPAALAAALTSPDLGAASA